MSEVEKIVRDGVAIAAVRGRRVSIPGPDGTYSMERAVVELARPGYDPGFSLDGMYEDQRSVIIQTGIHGEPVSVAIFADGLEDEWIDELVTAEREHQARRAAAREAALAHLARLQAGADRAGQMKAVGERLSIERELRKAAAEYVAVGLLTESEVPPERTRVRMTPAELRSIREAVGYSIEDLARGLGVSRSIVQKWESGASPVPAGVAGEIDAMQDAYADALEAALSAAAETIEVWPASLDDASWDATGRPSRWHRQIAAAARQEHGTRIVYYDRP